MGSIDWYGFTWEAFSTLAVGLAAVSGAFAIGWRQLKITERQAEILAQQVLVDQVKLRAELFDRRFKVYNAIKDYIRDAMGLRADFDPTPQIWTTLQIQLEQAQFLFTGTVQDRVRALAVDADRLLEEREKLTEARKKQVDVDVGTLEVAVRRQRDLLRENLSTLDKDMGADMQLYFERTAR